MRRIQNACKEHSVFVVLGYSEKDNGSIYMAQVGFPPSSPNEDCPINIPLTLESPRPSSTNPAN